MVPRLPHVGLRIVALCSAGLFAFAANHAAKWAKASKFRDMGNAAMGRGDIVEAAESFYARCRLLRKPNFEEKTPDDHPLISAMEEGFFSVGRVKLRHDAEQLEYLIGQGKLAADPYAHIAQNYRRTISVLPHDKHTVILKTPFDEVFDQTHNRALHLTRPKRVAGSVLSPTFDAQALQRRFHESELPPDEGCEKQNGITYADGLLSEPVLDTLYRWCLESTMWFGSRPGYVAAFSQSAFNAPLLLQVVEQLQSALPEVLGGHSLMNMWAFKYGHNASEWPVAGTAPHADAAAVNVNFWVTPDDANQDLEGGGLVVYTKQAPKEWGFEDYNHQDALPKIRKFLEDSPQIKIPYRRNRIVLFNSNLFHETQPGNFKPGYENRRINLTLLFGRRCGGNANTRVKSYIDTSVPEALKWDEL
eukprot:gnl/MRDRNA2_/MRDRNA2_33655_c0_seq1.p1 gnl/MRDRNA2_/MRDRNA2_33655_c0~~gnl/MRDRNA2_/MRDRNA2_33655_c0_seq1.p1  ORF type:complete len:418 (+),score=52.36 gnl/MRDRNA2_/MRDRNA2_33655_c0_seq1:110-1363(+)